MSSGTYSKIYIQLVFAVKGRKSLISSEWEEEVYKYITGIITRQGQKLIIMNGVSDHVHIFIGIKPSCRLSDLVREIKKSSSAFIKEKKFTPFKFEWQEGYGAFSYSHSAIDQVCKYIENQKGHHKKITFKEEYISLLQKFSIDFDQKYVFEFKDD